MSTDAFLDVYTLFQWMATGQNSVSGLNARNHVKPPAIKCEQENVIIQFLSSEVLNVREMTMTHDLATNAEVNIRQPLVFF